MKPKVSIIFTSYNHSEYLRQALDSLLSQTLKEFELIIVDDCSTDGSQEILKEYEEKDSRIRLNLLKENTGSYVHSSNFGAGLAIAPYIIFEQCDDFAEPTQLEKLYDAMQQYPNIGVVYSSSRMVDAQGCDLGNDYNYRSRRFKEKCITDVHVDRKDMGHFLLEACVIPNLSAALIKRTLFNKLGGLSTDYLVLADWDFWFKMANECDFYYLREPLNNFRQHNTTIRKSVKMNLQVCEVFEAYYNHFERAGIGVWRKIFSEFTIARIWLSYFNTGPKAWIGTFLPLLKTSGRYSLYFPLVFLLTGFYYPFLIVYQKLKRHVA